MRTLLIGLGGSGGEVLRNLYGQLSPKQKTDANCIYLDLDSQDVTRLRTLGVKTVRISSADTVGDVAAALGQEDGVYDWLPNGEYERVFLSSGTDDGASQNRYKSRLCLARFLKNPNNELHQLLSDLTRPGLEINSRTLRVMIVSSIAGGTGSGTFIEVALYVRKFFRDLGQPDVRITGLFACPDLFIQTLNNERSQETKRESMFANAYAAIRELNAMNLAVSGLCGVTNDYGKSIQISIDTHSEGKLFDSKDPAFSQDYATKPFDLLYFVDLANADGGILRGTGQYYKTMADIAYTRLFSGLEGTIESDESNELAAHTKVPTAIYGSAGYGRIRYPYEDILRYLAERRTCEELDYKWTFFENDWDRYCQEEQVAAMASGKFWHPSTAERGQNYIANMDAQLAKKTSPFQSISGMIDRDSSGYDRANAYLDCITDMIRSDSGFDGVADEKYGLGHVTAVAKLREQLQGHYDDGEDESGETYLERFQNATSGIAADLLTYTSKLLEAINRQAIFLSSAILPMTREAEQNARSNRENVNLHFGLLTQEGKDIHPLAARYLLYRVRQEMQDFVEGRKSGASCEDTLKQYCKNLDLTFDEDPGDDEDFTISDTVNALSRRFVRKSQVKASLKQYMSSFRTTMADIMNEATKELQYQTYTRVLEGLNILIGQYEGFFHNLKQYRTSLRQKTENDLMRHSFVDDRCIFVGATPEMKRYYYSAQPSIRMALESGNGEIYAAAGQGIFDALMERTWKKAEANRNAMLMRDEWDEPAQEEEDQYTDMGGIFDQIVETYTKYLREKATYLQTTAVGALIHQCCEENNLDPAKINSDPATHNVFQNAFREKIQDLIAKASPMVRYSEANREKYYDGEADVSERYVYLGMGAAAAREMEDIFPTSGGMDALDVFQQELGLARKPIVSGEFKQHDLFCFSAVHCLQPTQIYKFSENADGAYYHSYKRRLKEAMANYTLSMTPHIDKRWHLRGAMPYISRKLELQWREEIMKAFLYELLTREIGFTVDSDGRRCFISKREGSFEFIQWPERKLVLIQNVSRILEYLANQEELIPVLAKKLDTMIDYQIDLLSGYTGGLATYKGGMTKNDMLKLLRTDLLSFFRVFSETKAAHGKNAGASRLSQAGDAEAQAVFALRSVVSQDAGEPEEAPDLQKTMGGLLEVAWLVHKSEENLGEDRDYGEALLRCGAAILDRFCQNMYGNDWLLRENTAEYQEYVNLYNASMEKMMEEYVVATIRKRKLTPEQLTTTRTGGVSLMPTEPGAYPNLTIPEEIRNTREFAWISANWKLKSL